jgi:hypothetical protein
MIRIKVVVPGTMCTDAHPGGLDPGATTVMASIEESQLM